MTSLAFVPLTIQREGAMPRLATVNDFPFSGARRLGRRLAVAVGILILVWGILMATSPFVRLYSLAYLGNSDAMCKLSDEYYTTNGKVVKENWPKGDYWLRRSAKKYDPLAMYRIHQRWGQINSKEAVYWLDYGAKGGMPWCAEQLAQGYKFGYYYLTRDPVMARKYDDLAVEIRQKQGTLKDHACLFLPPAPRWAYPWDQPPPVPVEIHPGIPRKSVSKR